MIRDVAAALLERLDGGPLSTAVRRLRDRPAVVAVVAAVAVAELLVAAAVGILGAVQPLLSRFPLPTALAQVVGAVVLPVGVAAAYALVRADPPASTVTAVRRDAATLLAATLVQRAVGVVAVAGTYLLVLAVVGVGVTAFDVLRYAVDPTARGLPSPTLVVVLVGALFVVAGLIVALLLVFFDVLALYADVPPTRAWAASARFVAGYPRTALRYAVVRGTVAVPAAVVVVAATRADVGTLAERPALTVAGGLVAFAVVAGLRALGYGYHVAFFERTIAPVAGDLRGPVAHSRHAVGRGLLAAVVILAALGGVGALRAADARPYAPPRPTPVHADTSPAAMFAHADRQLRTASFRSARRTTTFNDTTGTERETLTWITAVDRRDNRLRIRVRGTYPNGTRAGTGLGGYLSDATLANRIGVDDDPTVDGGLLALHTRRGGWNVLPAPGYAIAGPGTAHAGLPADATVDWRVRNRTAENVTVAVTDPQAVARATSIEAVGDEGRVEDGVVRVTFDRSTGRVVRVVERVRYRPPTAFDRRPTVYVRVTTVEYGVDVRRPRAIGDPNAVELLWDAVFY
ncbi:MAG: hypothetical protein ABEI96_07340 [Haloarculaceae archaeon]